MNYAYSNIAVYGMVQVLFIYFLQTQEEFSGHTQAPHMEEHCERCKQLGRPCWNQDVPNTSQQDN